MEGQINRILELNSTEIPFNNQFKALGFESTYFLNNMGFSLSSYLFYLLLVPLLLLLRCRKTINKKKVLQHGDIQSSQLREIQWNYYNHNGDLLRDFTLLSDSIHQIQIYNFRRVRLKHIQPFFRHPSFGISYLSVFFVHENEKICFSFQNSKQRTNFSTA